MRSFMGHNCGEFFPVDVRKCVRRYEDHRARMESHEGRIDVNDGEGSQPTPTVISEYVLCEAHLREGERVWSDGPVRWQSCDDPGAFDGANRRRPQALEELINRYITVAFEKLEGGSDEIRRLLLIGPHGDEHRRNAGQHERQLLPHMPPPGWWARASCG